MTIDEAIDDAIPLLTSLKGVADVLNAVLKENLGEETKFVLYIKSAVFRGAVGSGDEADCIESLREIIVECEARAAAPATKH